MRFSVSYQCLGVWVGSLLLVLLPWAGPASGQADERPRLSFYVHDAYGDAGSTEAVQMEGLLRDVFSGDESAPFSGVDVTWLPYGAGHDFMNDAGPSVALMTVGMYLKAVAHAPDSTGEVIHRSVKRHGTTTYRFFVIAPRGSPLTPEAVKGRLRLKRKTSLSGSLFAIDYLVRRHGFPAALLNDDSVRWAWGIEQSHHERLVDLVATPDSPVYCGEGIDVDRVVLERNGWTVYPRPGEEDAAFRIPRAIVMSRNFDDRQERALQNFLAPSNPHRNRALALLGITGLGGLDPEALAQTKARYRKLTSPYVSVWGQIVSKVLPEWPFYVICIVLLFVAHLAFRYLLLRSRDGVLLMLLLVVIKIATFLVVVWLVPANFAVYVSSAILLGAAEPKAILKLLKRHAAVPVDIALPPPDRAPDADEGESENPHPG